MSLLDPEVFKSYCHPIMLKDLAAQKIVYSFPSPLAKELRVLTTQIDRVDRVAQRIGSSF